MFSPKWDKAAFEQNPKILMAITSILNKLTKILSAKFPYYMVIMFHTIQLTQYCTEWCYMEILHLPAQVGVSDDHYPVLRHVRTLSPTRVYALWHVYSSWLPTTGVVVWARYRYLPLGVLSGSGHRTAAIHSRKHTMRMTFNAKNICLISICSYVFKHHSVIAFFGNQLLLLLLFLA